MSRRRAGSGLVRSDGGRARAALLVLALAPAACAPAVRPVDGGAPGDREAATTAATRSDVLPAPGRGSLRQDDFTVALRSGALQIKVTPLAEGVIRLAAPDTYERLHALASSRMAEAERASGVKDPALFLVSFFSHGPDADYEPESLQIEQSGRILQAAAVLPLTPGWGRQRLDQRETRSAIYVFREPIDLDLPLTVRYGAQRSELWQRILPRLESERLRIRARARG